MSNGDPDYETLRTGARGKLLEFLRDGGGDFLQITYDKANNRGVELSADPDEPGKWVFKLERHRAIAGASYVPGSGMAAYETYAQVCGFDPNVLSLEQISEEHISYVFDFYSLAVENLNDSSPTVSKKKSWKHKRRVEIISDNVVFDAQTLEAATELIEEHYRGWGLDHYFEGLEISGDQRREYVKRLSDAIVEQAVRLLKRNWEDPQVIEE